MTVGKSFAPNALGNTSASTQRTSTEFGSEEQIELAISAAMQRMCSAPDRAGKMRHWREMCRLIDQRTPSRRRFMERVAGLACKPRAEAVE
jgi:hypothetical protein